MPATIAAQMEAALRKAGTTEIGGVLMGEHVGDEDYVVREIAVQTGGGTFASFVRGVQGALRPLTLFFRSRGHDYRRFNYVGEWHSHPSFVCEPSARDEDTMWDIVDDPQVGAHFVVLLVVQLGDGQRVRGTATVYAPNRIRVRAELSWEEHHE